MPAKDYKLCVSGLMGTPFISKVSKTNPNLMLSDRRQVPLPEMYVAIEQFAKGQIKEGFSTLEVTAGGKMVFEICLPNPKAEQREKDYRQKAIDTLELTKGYTPEQRDFLNDMHNMLETMETLAGYILELTK
jgi:hypothetical protein